MILRRAAALFTLTTLALAALSPAARAQAPDAAAAYPNKAIRFIVPAPAGGPSDVIARLVADKLGAALGQQVLVENRAGAAQTLGSAMVAKAEPDGYTLLFTTSTPIVMTPFTTKKPAYDVKRDFAVVAHVGTTPLVLYANAAVPAVSIKEMVALAKNKPGELSYGSYGIGSSAHLLGEYLSAQAAIKLVHVPYKGVAPEVQDLVGGQIQFGVADIGVPAPFVKSGQLRALAVTGNKRAPALPDVPTFAEQGIAGMEPFSPWWGVFAPAATPKRIVDRLGAEVVKIVKSPDFESRLRNFGGDPTGLLPEPATAATLAELTRWQKIISDLPHLKFDD